MQREMRVHQLRAVVGLFLASLVVSSLGVSRAHAAPSLILLEDNGDRNPVYRHVIESLGAVIVANNVSRYYDHIDVLTGPLANREALFAQIRKRGAKSAVDVVLLTHGSNKSLALSLGDLTERDLLAQGVFPKLRMVYMMACYSASMESAWQAAGAQVVVGHQDVNSLSGFFFPRFLKRWAEGATARDAADDAYRFSETTASMLSGFIQEDQNLLSQVGVSRSEPVIQGVDIDRMGHVYPEHVLTIAPTQFRSESLDEGLTYSHSDFERLGISLMSSMIPQASLKVDAIPSAQKLLERVRGVAWDQLHDSFPNPASSDFGDIGLPSEDGQEIWIDGEAIRYFLSSVRDYAGDKLGPVLDHVQGARLTRQGEFLNAGLYFDKAFDISLQDPKKIPNWQPYAVHVPKTVRFQVRMNDDVLSVSGLDKGADTLVLKLKMPALPDSIWLRTASVNLSTGHAHVEAGVIGDFITVIANADITTRKFDGVDVWESIKRNLDLIFWPALVFRL